MCLWLTSSSAVDREAYRDGCCVWLYDISRNPSICQSIKSLANEGKCIKKRGDLFIHQSIKSPSNVQCDHNGTFLGFQRCVFALLTMIPVSSRSVAVFTSQLWTLHIRVLHFLRRYLKVSLRLWVPAGLTIDLSRAAEADSWKQTW